jgi:UDP-glucose 4-epimerase
MIKKRILVTGGSGKFGSQLCEVLFLAGYEPCIIDRKNNSYESVPLFGMLAEMDLLDTDSVTELMQKEKFAAVIHCAYAHDEADSFLRPDFYYENNFGGTLSLLKAMKNANLSILISHEHQAGESPLQKSYQMTSQLLLDAEKAYQWKIAILATNDPAAFVEKLRGLLRE